MGIRSTTSDTGLRALVGNARGVMVKADDNHQLQECDIELLFDEKKPAVERFQEYGFTGVPKKPDSQEQAQQSQQGPHEAENILMFLGTERTHAVIIRIDDRRYRLRNMQEGEVCLYDDQQQKVAIKRGQILTRSQFKIALRVVKDENQADEQAGRDQSKQDDDANGGGQQQSSNGGGQQQESKKTKPLSSYIADKDSAQIVRTTEDGDMRSQVILEKAQSSQSGGQQSNDDKITATTPLPLVVLMNNKNKQIKETTPKNTLLLQEKVTNDEVNEPRTRVELSSMEDDSLIEIKTKSTSITWDEQQKTITINAQQSIILNAQHVYLGSQQADKPISMKGTINTRGDADVINLSKQVYSI